MRSDASLSDDGNSKQEGVVGKRVDGMSVSLLVEVDELLAELDIITFGK